jgi:hypothetical protein
MLGRPTSRWNVIIKMSLKGIWYDDADYVSLAQNRDR